ncbi:glutamine amidotransferase [Brachybacterium squillarum]|uniref:glutamine amidotransferase n=1 Tax=Brachybacterium squillarum TaxID=661979 RepID=UPI002223E24E|nr:glutamine amidotransferase [Brachybacterium squillarum]MCW1805399.1 glutamine amidotransferase [Brachybacterium squillarum]
MKPFVLISTRPEDDVAEREHESVLRFTGLDERDLRRVRLEKEEAPVLRADEVSGVILAGSPFTVSEPAETKSALELATEPKLFSVLDQVIAQDLPFLGACYGVGALGTHQGARIDRTYGEELSAVEVTLTEEGLADPLVRAAGLPPVFTGLVGHKEAVHTLPSTATVLATGEACPVQMFRIGTRQYATQFHPEMDVPLLLERAARYQEHGYFDPEQMDELFGALGQQHADEAPLLLRGFAEHFAR